MCVRAAACVMLGSGADTPFFASAGCCCLSWNNSTGMLCGRVSFPPDLTESKLYNWRTLVPASEQECKRVEARHELLAKQVLEHEAHASSREASALDGVQRLNDECYELPKYLIDQDRLTHNQCVLRDQLARPDRQRTKPAFEMTRTFRYRRDVLGVDYTPAKALALQERHRQMPTRRIAFFDPHTQLTIEGGLTREQDLKELQLDQEAWQRYEADSDTPLLQLRVTPLEPTPAQTRVAQGHYWDQFESKSLMSDQVLSDYWKVQYRRFLGPIYSFEEGKDQRSYHWFGREIGKLPYGLVKDLQLKRVNRHTHRNRHPDHPLYSPATQSQIDWEYHPRRDDRALHERMFKAAARSTAKESVPHSTLA
jgi:hypothetical protein